MTRYTRRDLLQCLAGGLLAPLLPGCSGPPARPDTLARGDRTALVAYLDALCTHTCREQGLVGLSIALLDGREPVWAQGYGHADRDAGVPAGPDTRYRAGSVSKLFTSLAAMQLAEAGELDIDAPLHHALPGFAMRSHLPRQAHITPRMLMTHHAGLPSDYVEGMWGEPTYRFPGLLPLLRDEYYAFAPNQVYAYSNLGMTLLGAAVEQIDGRPFEQCLQQRVLEPLGMTASAFDILAPRGPGAAAAYDAEGRLAQEPGLRDTPAGGLNTTVLDLLRFAGLWFEPQPGVPSALLSAEGLREMLSPQNDDCALDLDLRVGLGWHFAPGTVPGGGPVAMHTGATLNHRATLMLLPEHRLAVAVMSNSANALQATHNLAAQALSVLLEHKTGTRAPQPGAPRPVDPRHLPATLASFPGHYATELGFVSITGTGDGLTVHGAGQRLQLKQLPNGYLALQKRLLGLIDIDLGSLGDYELTLARIAGHELLLARDRGGFLLAGERLAPPTISSAWEARLGDYRYVGKDAFIASKMEQVQVRLLREDGFLLVETTGAEGTQRLALRPLSDAAAVIDGLGRGRGDTVRVQRDDQGELLCHAGMCLRRTNPTRSPA